jgi:predicted permease
MHLALLAEELVRAGLSEEAARLEAERRFGPLEERRAELCRLAERRHQSHERTLMWSGIRHDLSMALRSARRNPLLFAISTLILGLGIGATTTVFSLFTSVILRPLPYRDPSRLVVIWQTSRAGSGEFASGVFDSAKDAAEWGARSRSFESLAELTWVNSTQVYRPDRGAPRDVVAIQASDNLFDMLGVRAELGRTFASDAGANGCEVVLSHAFWQASLGGDATALGKPITIGDARCAVIGVMPASFQFYPRNTDMWSLMTPATDTMLARHPDRYLVGLFGRLRRGVSAERAQRELRAIQASGADQTAFRRAFSPTVFDLQQEFAWLAGRNLRTTIVVLLGAVALVLIVVCVNIANLTLGRLATREREFAVRVALGSGRWRLARQLVTESALLACCGSIFGVAIAIGGMAYINSGKTIELPPGAAARLDLTGAIVTIAVTVFATMVIGLAPAVRATRVNTANALKSSGWSASGDRRSGRMAGVLVVCQVSVSVILLVGAALLVESVTGLANAPLGYSSENMLTVHVDVASRDTMEVKRAFDDALERVRAVPGVGGAAWTSVIPLEGRGDVESIVVEGHTVTARDSVPDVGAETISDSYFRVLEIPLLQGRTFASTDDASGPPSAIVNRAFVDRFLGGGEAIGQRIKFGGPREPWLTIVGVVGNERRTTVTQEMSWVSPPMVFRPMRQAGVPRSMILLVRAASSGSVNADAVQRAVRSASADAVITDVATMRELLDRVLSSPRTRAESVAALALLAFTLAVIGLYGLLSQLVTNRTREIGIRVALGAQVEQVVVSVVGRGVLLAAVGVTLGCVAAVPAAASMRALLYGVTTFDIRSIATAAAAMIVTAVLASALPARRASAVDPVIALRSE